MEKSRFAEEEPSKLAFLLKSDDLRSVLKKSLETKKNKETKKCLYFGAPLTK